MNRHCHGEVLRTPTGDVYYRCLLDSTLIPMGSEWNFRTCPKCKREAKPESWDGVDVEVRTVHQIRTQGGAWLDRPGPWATAEDFK